MAENYVLIVLPALKTYAIKCDSFTTLAFDFNLPNVAALLCSFKTTDGHEVKLVNLWWYFNMFLEFLT